MEPIDPDTLMDGFSRKSEGSVVILSLRPSLHGNDFNVVVVMCGDVCCNASFFFFLISKPKVSF